MAELGLVVGGIVIGFIIGCACRYLEIYFERKNKKECEQKEHEQKTEEIHVPIFREDISKIVPLFATVNIPKERIIAEWNVERNGIKDELFSKTYAEKRLKNELADLLWEFATVTTEEDMMNLTVRYKAMVRVVKS